MQPLPTSLTTTDRTLHESDRERIVTDDLGGSLLANARSFRLKLHGWLLCCASCAAPFKLLPANLWGQLAWPWQTCSRTVPEGLSRKTRPASANDCNALESVWLIIEHYLNKEIQKGDSPPFETIKDNFKIILTYP